jgi:hypothetical protein
VSFLGLLQKVFLNWERKRERVWERGGVWEDFLWLGFLAGFYVCIIDIEVITFGQLISFLSTIGDFYKAFCLL